MVMGQHHHVSPQYLYQFANDAAWKEDHRRLSNGELSHKKLALAMAHTVRRVWTSIGSAPSDLQARQKEIEKRTI